jgi:hypothetical protein
MSQDLEDRPWSEHNEMPICARAVELGRVVWERYSVAVATPRHPPEWDARRVRALNRARESER